MRKLIPLPVLHRVDQRNIPQVLDDLSHSDETLAGFFHPRRDVFPEMVKLQSFAQYGLLISWATPAASWPIEASFSDRRGDNSFAATSGLRPAAVWFSDNGGGLIRDGPESWRGRDGKRRSWVQDPQRQDLGVALAKSSVRAEICHLLYVFGYMP